MSLHKKKDLFLVEGFYTKKIVPENVRDNSFRYNDLIVA